MLRVKEGVFKDISVITYTSEVSAFPAAYSSLGEIQDPTPIMALGPPSR